MPLDAPQPEVTGAPFMGTATYEPQDLDTVKALALNEAEGGDVVRSDESTEGVDRNGRRRRGRRGGRRLRGENEGLASNLPPDDDDVTEVAEFEVGEVSNGAAASVDIETAPAAAAEVTSEAAEEATAPKVRKPRAPRKPRKVAGAESAIPEVASEAVAEGRAEAPAAAPAETTVNRPIAVEPPVTVTPEPEPQAPLPEPITTEPVVIGSEPAAPRRAGWWAKAKSALGG
jgi:ribonuclease E